MMCHAGDVSLKDFIPACHNCNGARMSSGDTVEDVYKPQAALLLSLGKCKQSYAHLSHLVSSG